MGTGVGQVSLEIEELGMPTTDLPLELGRSLSISGPHFPHLQNEDSKAHLSGSVH